MKRMIALVCALAVACCAPVSACALDLGDALGGWTSLFSADEETYDVGEVAESDGISIELVQVMQSVGNRYETPAQGKEFLILEFEVENNSEEDLALSTMLSFSTWCDDELCSISLEALSAATLAGKYQLDRVVDPGECVTGVIGYEVPEDWSEVRVQFSKDVLSSKKITFAVNQ